jgi:excinuclease ABC subunit A
VEIPELNKNKKHHLEIIIKQIVNKKGIRSRLFDSFEAALRQSAGLVIVDIIGQEEILFSEHYSCPIRGFTVGELEPRVFSFNAPFGTCPDCDGLYVKLEVNLDSLVPDQTKTLREGALVAWNLVSTIYYPQILEQAMVEFNIDMDTPFEKLAKEEQKIVLNGFGTCKFHFRYENDFGVCKMLRQLLKELLMILSTILRRPTLILFGA